VGEAAGAGRILEVGIGTGASIPHYRAGASVIGIDLSAGMLAVARNRLPEAGSQFELLEMDAQHLSFPDHSFDSVVFDLCLCTVPEPRLAIAEGIRVARPGATMVFLEHVRSGIPPLAVVQEMLTLVTGRTEHDFWNRRTPDLIRDAGIRVLSDRRWLLGVFALIVGRAPTVG